MVAPNGNIAGSEWQYRVAPKPPNTHLGVLTFDHHIERSRLVFQRCWDQDLHLYEFQPPRQTRHHIYDFVYAMAAYGKTFVVPGCQTQPPGWLQEPIEWIKRVR